MIDKRSVPRFVRQLGLAALLREGVRGTSPRDQWSVVGGYSADEDPAARRLSSDTKELVRCGLTVESTATGRHAVGAVKIPAHIGEAVREAAAELGAGYVYASSLKLALWKLTRTRWTPKKGVSAAAVYSDQGRHNVYMVDQALTRRQMLNEQRYLRDLSFAPQAIVLGRDRVQLVGCMDSGWKCVAAEDLTLVAEKWLLGGIELVELPEGVVEPQKRLTHLGSRSARVIEVDGFSYCWALAQMLALGEAKSVDAVTQRIGGDVAAVGLALTAISLAQVGHEFLAFGEVRASGRIDFELDVRGEVLTEDWPLTPREVRAAVGALLLAGNDSAARELELVTGVESRVIVTDQVIDDAGQLEICAAA